MTNLEKAQKVSKAWGWKLEDVIQAMEDGTSYSLEQASLMQAAGAVLRTLTQDGEEQVKI